MEAACAKAKQGRKRVYVGLGHKRGSLSWFSPFSHFSSQWGLTVLVLGLQKCPQHHDGGQLFFPVADCPMQLDFAFVRQLA